MNIHLGFKRHALEVKISPDVFGTTELRQEALIKNMLCTHDIGDKDDIRCAMKKPNYKTEETEP